MLPLSSGHQYNYHRRSTGHLLGSSADNRTTTDYGFIDAPPPTQQTTAKFEPNREDTAVNFHHMLREEDYKHTYLEMH